MLHAISDALLGAAGLRDIGYYFPDTDPKNKNLSSLKFRKCIRFIKNESVWSQGILILLLFVSNQKLDPYVNHIKKSLSSILNIRRKFYWSKGNHYRKDGSNW